MTTDFPALTEPTSPPIAPAPPRGRPGVDRKRLRPDLERLRTSRWVLAAGLALITLTSLWLRTRGLHIQYWVDEGLSVGLASHPLGHIPGLLHQDGSPPLYYLLLHLWMSVRGRGEVATHELSLIFALLTIPVAYWAGTSLFRRRAGVICAILAAGAPYLTNYAQETRMYALLALLALLVGASFLQAFVYRRRGYLPVFSLSLVAALYTHNWALFLGLMSGIAFLLCVRESPRSGRRALWRDGLVAFGAVAVLYAPWVPTLLFQAGHTGAPWDLGPRIWSISQGLYSLVGGRGAAVAVLLAGGSGLLALRHYRGRPRPRVVLAVWCLLLLGLGTLLLAWLYSKTSPAWAIRYLAVIVGPLILLAGLGLARAGSLGLVAVALVASFWLLDPPVQSTLVSKSNVGAAAARVRPELGRDALVLSTQPEQIPTLAYYLPAVSHFGTPLGPVPDPRAVDWTNALGRLRHSSVHSVLMPMVDRLPAGGRLLLVLPTNLAKSPLWMKLINRDSIEWRRTLTHDPQLALLKVTTGTSRRSGVAVSAYVFAKRWQGASVRR